MKSAIVFKGTSFNNGKDLSRNKLSDSAENKQDKIPCMNLTMIRVNYCNAIFCNSKRARRDAKLAWLLSKRINCCWLNKVELKHQNTTLWF